MNTDGKLHMAWADPRNALNVKAATSTETGKIAAIQNPAASDKAEGDAGGCWYENMYPYNR